MHLSTSDSERRSAGRAHHDEAIAIGCALALALLTIAGVLVYLWIW